MSVKTIPAKAEWACDCCKVKTETKNDRDRPAHWAEFALYRSAYDMQGCAVADASIKRTLCGRCGDMIADALNNMQERLRESEG